ncbi:hypothetical protein FRC11_006854, partial [Ceratobasidium sp. 423]
MAQKAWNNMASKVEVLAGVKVIIEALVVDVKACAAALVGVKVDLDAEFKAKIAAVIVAIISIGVQACLALWAQIDVAIHLLILTLNVCVAGLLKVIINL